MKRLLIILLILIAVPLWVWDTHLVLTAAFADKNKKHASDKSAKIAPTFAMSLGEVHFVEKGRNPFTAYKETPKPKSPSPDSKKKVAQATQAAPATPPPITINGIMWNESNPIAMLNLADGSSTVARKGQTLSGGITVKTIEKNQVEVEFNGKSFWLKK
jgi:type IV pilus biogenesis protein PilP